eukprot:SAG11_NODE_19983_length_455_cov_0.466292_2_plen_86_part_01
MAFCEHGAGQCQAVYDKQGSILVTLGADSAMLVRDPESGAELNLIADEHAYTAITAVAVDTESKMLVSGCGSGFVRVFSFPDMSYK